MRTRVGRATRVPKAVASLFSQNYTEIAYSHVYSYSYNIRI